MSLIHSSLLHVIKRFPSRKETIKRLYREKDDFEILCDDYLLCLEAVTRWERYHSEEAPQRRQEYSDLLQGLELQILRSLDEST